VIYIFKYIVEIDNKGNILNSLQKENAVNILSVQHKDQSVFEIGFKGIRPYARSQTSQLEIRPRKYIGLNKDQHHITRFLLLLLNTIITIKSEKHTVYTKGRLHSYPVSRFSVDKRDEFFLAELFYLECFKNQRYLKRISKIVHSISKLRKLKTEKVIIEKLEQILHPTYLCNIQLIPCHILLIHLLNNKSISRFHHLIEHIIFNTFDYSQTDYLQKKSLIESSSKPNENIQLRMVKEYNKYIVFEIFNQ